MRRALGRKLSAALSATLVIYQLGSCAAYLIIVGDSFGPLLAGVRQSNNTFPNDASPTMRTVQRSVCV